METKKYKVKGGGVIEATTDFELVEMLKNSSFTESNSQQEFMEQWAERCMLQSEAVIRTNNPVVFIQDSIAHGFLTLIAPE